jgi:predicted permease
MPRFANLVRGLGSLLRNGSIERSLDEELQDFEQASIAEKTKRGLSAEEAARAARVEIGSTNSVKHQIRSVGWESRMEILIHDLRYAMRTLRRSPGFTLVAVISLALGIGANTAIFTLIRQVVLQQLPVRNPQELVCFGKSLGGGILGGIDLGVADQFTYDFARQVEQQPGPFQGIAAYSSFPPTANVRVPHSAVSVQVPGTLVSGNFFDVLGAAPMLGRTIAARDADMPDGNAVAVISYRFWQQSLSSDPDVIGTTVAVNGTPFTIIGVMPEEFQGLRQGVRPNDFWFPLTMAQEVMLHADMLRPRNFYFLHVVARRNPNDSLAADQNWLDRQIRDYVRAGEGAAISAARQREIERLTVPLVPAAKGVSELRSVFGDSLLILSLIVAVVLLIACANLANFLLARAVARRREVATRLALGSSRARIVRQSVVEALLLSLAGALAGLGVAFAGTRALIGFVAQGAPSTSLSALPDTSVLAFTFAVAVIAGLLFGLAPAFQVARSSAGPALNSTTRMATAGGGRGTRFWPRALITTQVVLSLLLLIIAGLFIRTLRNLQAQNLGFERDHLLIAHIEPNIAGYKPVQVPVLNQRLLEALSAIPGVRSAALAEGPPISSATWISTLKPAGYMPGPREDMSSVLKRVSGQYFETTGTAIVAGRPITPSDTASSQKVIVVNEIFARKYFPHGDAIGRTVKVDIQEEGPWQIVGIARDTRAVDPREAPKALVYFPLFQLTDKKGEGAQDSFATSVLLRTSGDPTSATRALRSAIASVDPNLPILDTRTIQEHVETFMASETLISRLTAAFAMLAVVLAAIGLYGVMSFNIALQTNEIGIRMALGASSSGVQWMILRESLKPLVAGVILGLPLAFTAAGLLRSKLYGMSPFDPVIFFAAVAGISFVALLSAWLPARRAAAIDPMSALRCD